MVKNDMKPAENNYLPCFQKKEEGFILVVTMVVLVMLTLIGLAAINMTRTELLISGNDRVHKETFYQADGGTEIGLRMIYDNAICATTSGGFTGDYGGAAGNSYRLLGKSVVVEDLVFSLSTPAAIPVINPTDPGDPTGAAPFRHAVYYPDVDLTAGPGHTAYDTSGVDPRPHTNILVSGETKSTPGAGFQQLSGYAGLGGGSAAGGTYKEYTIGASHVGKRNSNSLVTIKWKMSTHILNNASSADCKY